MTELANRLALPARWLMVAAIAYTLAQSVLYFVSPPAPPQQGQMSPRPAAQSQPATDLNAILASNLFGSAEAGAAAVEEAPTVATRLPLDLLGVFVADDADNSAAIISQRGRQGLLYTVDQDVPGNATLVEVAPDHVVLLRAGVRETLHFPGPTEAIASRARMNIPPLDDGGAPAADYIESSAEDLDPGADDASYGDDYNEITQDTGGVDEVVNEYRERLEEDPSGTMEDLGVSAVSEGAAEGYRIGDLAQSPYLSQTGLQPGDVILSVNGRPVGDLDQDRLELANVLAEGSARLEVQRGTRRFFVTASLQQ